MPTPRKTTTKPRAGRISVGIGSWADPEYTDVLYPRGVKSEERLKIFAAHFGHVEVNATYYRVPPASVFAAWVRQTPPDFRFDLKLPMAFSRSPAKTAAGPFITKFLATAKSLIRAGKVGAFFLVLPPSFEPERHRLEELDRLAERLRPHLLAVELRHNGWVTRAQRQRTLEYFRSRQLVWIAVDMPRVPGSTIMPAVDEVTNPQLAYLRLHGRNRRWPELKSAEEKHTYAYSAAELKQIAKRVRALAAQAREVHVVANNHAQDFAPKTALALQRLLGVK